MDNNLTHGIGLVFYFFILWVFLQLAYAAWGHKWAKPQWIALVNTRFMRRLHIKWVSVGLVVIITLQIALVISMLGISAWTGRPISFD